MRKLSVSVLTLALLLGGACGEDMANSPGGTGGAAVTGGAAATGGARATGGAASTGGAAATGGAPATTGGAGTGGGSGGAATGGARADAAAGTGGGFGNADAGAADAARPPDATSSAPDPNAPCPRCVKIFTGTSWDGWEAAPSTWSLVGGAMRGIGGTSRAAYTKADYGNVRLIVTSRINPQNGDHLGILFWGNRPMDPNRPQIDNAGWVQWMPPFGGMWSYHPPMHHGLRAMKIATSPAKATEWHTSELLLNLDKGTLRVAVNGLETTRYTHEWPTERTDPTKRIIKGPLAMMRHGGGGSEYKDIWVEADPTEDKLYTVKQ
jgi:hypothetical protein